MFKHSTVKILIFGLLLACAPSTHQEILALHPLAPTLQQAATNSPSSWWYTLTKWVGVSAAIALVCYVLSCCSEPEVQKFSTQKKHTYVDIDAEIPLLMQKAQESLAAIKNIQTPDSSNKLREQCNLMRVLEHRVINILNRCKDNPYKTFTIYYYKLFAAINYYLQQNPPLLPGKVYTAFFSVDNNVGSTIPHTQLLKILADQHKQATNFAQTTSQKLAIHNASQRVALLFRHAINKENFDAYLQGEKAVKKLCRKTIKHKTTIKNQLQPLLNKLFIAREKLEQQIALLDGEIESSLIEKPKIVQNALIAFYKARNNAR